MPESLRPDTVPTHKSEHWVIVYEPADQAEALVIVALLHSAGIIARLQQEALGTLYGLSVGVGAIQVEVPASQAETAAALFSADIDTDGKPLSE